MEPVTVLDSDGANPVALVGNADLLMTLGTDRQAAVEAMEQALAVMSGLENNLERSRFAADLRSIPKSANLLLIGEVPSRLLDDLPGNPHPFPKLPRHIVLHAVANKEINISLQGIMQDAVSCMRS